MKLILNSLLKINRVRALPGWVRYSAIWMALGLCPIRGGANAFYDTFKQGILGDTAFDLDNDVIKASLIDSADYTFSAAHDEYSGGARDVPAAAIVAESGALTSPTTTNGTFDTADFTWSAVTGDQSEAIILWDDTLTNDRLIAFYDTSITGMPVTPNGGDINVTVDGSGWWSL